ncbi:hypothetical protein AVEN_247406-1 [Araneus ventricosus]|uniref:RNase H type-1 domain-containing protein n=1 Tax=Araneus ventricosus TaxID=182803 RepID=A0A4Y2M3K2_ARAVE|nr:hypothetical protein AVEN_247406-1 [Araneus ventricosus]
MDSDPNGRFKKIFTDASKLNGRVGSGVVCLHEGRDIIWKGKILLNDEASVFVDEAVAIQMAVENVGSTKEKTAIFLTPDPYLNLTKPAEVNRISWMRSIAGNKLSRNKIIELLRFLLSNEALIKIR